MSVKAFIFDLDGVITDTANYHMQAWKVLADSLSLQFNETVNEQLKGISRMESLDIILAYNGAINRYSDIEKNELADKKNKYYQQLIETITENDYLPGIKTLLEKIKESGYRIALASASKNAPTILRALKADQYFDYVVDPASVKQGKPAPDIFLKAADYFSLHPHQCIGIEDAKSGIEAINRAEMFSVGVGDRESLKEADLYVENTANLNLELIIKSFLQKV